MRNTVRDQLLDIQHDVRKLRRIVQDQDTPVTGIQLDDLCRLIDNLAQTVLELADNNRLTTT